VVVYSVIGWLFTAEMGRCLFSRLVIPINSCVNWKDGGSHRPDRLARPPREAVTVKPPVLASSATPTPRQLLTPRRSLRSPSRRRVRAVLAVGFTSGQSIWSSETTCSEARRYPSSVGPDSRYISAVTSNNETRCPPHHGTCAPGRSTCCTRGPTGGALSDHGMGHRSSNGSWRCAPTAVASASLAASGRRFLTQWLAAST
jgi:hypothetical protein